MTSSTSTTAATPTRIDVTFDSAGHELAGHLHLPAAGTSANGRAVVVGHPGSGVKEQAAGLYAARLAARGVVALAFDAAHQGESSGSPRGLENPAQRVEDLKAAVSFLTARPEVDAERIGVLGICASGGYALTAVASDPRVKALATVSAVDIARQFRLGADGGQDPAVFAGMVRTAGRSRSAAARGEVVADLTLFPRTVEEARAAGGEHGAEGFDYYRTPRAEHERSGREMPWQSIDLLATYDAFANLPLLAQRPLLLFAGTRAVTSWMSVEVFGRVSGPKELVWVDGASHVDLYDRDEYVTPVVDRLTTFYAEHLVPVAP